MRIGAAWLCVMACSPRPHHSVPAPLPERPPAELEQDCDRGDRAACTTLGERFLAHDTDRGEVLLELACAAFEARACLTLGRRYHGERAIEYLERACLADELHGCVGLAHALDDDIARAASLYEFACDQGHIEGCLGAAQLVVTERIAAERASDQLRNACERGAGLACVAEAHALLASVTAEGPVVARLLERGCEHGDALACARHGLMLYYGWGVHKERPRALAQLRKACAAELEAACHGLSVPDLLEAGCTDPSECATAVEAWEDGGARGLRELLLVIGRGLVRTCGGACRVRPSSASEPAKPRSVHEAACERDRAQCAAVSLEHALVVAEGRCSAGSLSHCVALANQLPAPEPGAEDSALLPIWARACELDHGHSCAQLGTWYVGDGNEHGYGVELLRRACELEVASGCAVLEQLGLSP